MAVTDVTVVVANLGHRPLRGLNQSLRIADRRYGLNLTGFAGPSRRTTAVVSSAIVPHEVGQGPVSGHGITITQRVAFA